jgi:hypothetical protein
MYDKFDNTYQARPARARAARGGAARRCAQATSRAPKPAQSVAHAVAPAAAAALLPGDDRHRLPEQDDVLRGPHRAAAAVVRTRCGAARTAARRAARARANEVAAPRPRQDAAPLRRGPVARSHAGQRPAQRTHAAQRAACSTQRLRPPQPRCTHACTRCFANPPALASRAHAPLLRRCPHAHTRCHVTPPLLLLTRSSVCCAVPRAGTRRGRSASARSSPHTSATPPSRSSSTTSQVRPRART